MVSSLILVKDFDAVFVLIDIVIREEVIYVYNMHIIVANTLVSALHPCVAGAFR
jgi:hypothetical protein